ncbi:hypothetical protein [Streptomyces sp. NPDC002845]
MEQRIGSSSQPLDAGFNPAHIPGLTSPASDEPEDATEDATEEAPETAEDTSEDLELTDATDATDEAPEDSDEPEETPEGPVFEAADRRARIVADHKGVRLRLDDQECEFRWDEIGAVETESPRFGKRFTVTVHTPDSRWYPIEIEAKAKSQHEEWDTRLDEVLDKYFEDEAAK